jgi:hypothetical protein
VGASTSENEQKTINQFISSAPGGLLSQYMNDPKLHALADSMQNSINTIKNQYGFHPFNGNRGPQGQQELPSTPPSQAVVAAPPKIDYSKYNSVYSPKLGRNVLVPK